MSKWILAAALAGLMGGCAICREHPVACAIGSAVVVGSVAAIVVADRNHNSNQMHERQIAPGGSPQCREGCTP